MLHHEESSEKPQYNMTTPPHMGGGGSNFAKYLIGIKFDKAGRPLVLIMSKMSGYVKTFKVE